MRLKCVNILTLAMIVLIAGCGERHKFIQQDQGKYLVYVQPPIEFARPSPIPEPLYCTKIVDVPYEPPLEQNWFERLFNIQKDKTFKGCGRRDWEQKEGIWIADVKYDTSLVEKIGPMLSGAAFMAGTMGGAAILGGYIEKGLRGQATGNSGPNLYASTISGQPIPGLRFVNP